MRVIISGATGFIGTELIRYFNASGVTVIGLARRPPRNTMGIQWVCISLGKKIHPGVLTGTDLFIHLAHDMSPKSQKKNILGTACWFYQAKAQGVSKQLFLTSYSAHHSAPSEYGRAKFFLEIFFIENNQFVLRPGLVIGRGGLFSRMVRAVQSLPIVPVLGGSQVRIAITDIDTLCQVIGSVTRLRRGVIYGLFQKDHLAFNELIRAIRQSIGAHNLIVPISIAWSKAFLRLTQILNRSTGVHRNAFLALVKSQAYNYSSSYSALGIREHSLQDLIGRYL